jgi:hypothetical protein
VATELTDDFRPGRRYLVKPDPQPGDGRAVASPALVEDESGGVVARLPGGQAGGEVTTRAGTWTIGAERVSRGWDVTACDADGGRQLAVAHPRWRPRSYDIDVSDVRYRLKGNVITHSWTLRGSGGRIARLASGRFYVSSITTFDTPLALPPLALLIAIALELDRMESSMPEGQLGSGGGPTW